MSYKYNAHVFAYPARRVSAIVIVALYEPVKEGIRFKMFLSNLFHVTELIIMPDGFDINNI